MAVPHDHAVSDNDRVLGEVAVWLEHLVGSKVPRMHGLAVAILHMAVAAGLVEKVATLALESADQVDAKLFTVTGRDAARVRNEATLLADAFGDAQNVLDGAHNAATDPAANYDTQRELTAAARATTQTTALGAAIVDHIRSMLDACPQPYIWNLAVAACSTASSLNAAQIALTTLRRPIADPAERELLNRLSDEMAAMACAARQLAATATTRSAG